MKVKSILFLLSVIAGLFVSCEFLGINNVREYSLLPVDQETHIPHEDFFYIKVESAFFTDSKSKFNPLDFSLYARDEGIEADCKIPVSAESTEDLHCTLDIMEGDLWVHEINLEYNLPPGMCHYLGFQPHWHYNIETGIGPLFVRERKVVTSVSEDGEEETETEYIACEDRPGNRTFCSNRRCDRENECTTASHSCNNNTGDAGTWTEPREAIPGFCSNRRCLDKAECTTPTARCHAGIWETAYCYPSDRCKTKEHCEDADHSCHTGGRVQADWRENYCFGAPQCTLQSSCENPRHGCHQGLWDANSGETPNPRSCSVTKCTTYRSCVDPEHACHAEDWTDRVPPVAGFCSHPACTNQAECENPNHVCNNRAGTWNMSEWVCSHTPGIGPQESADKACPYIHTSKNEDEKNCCFGEYQVFKQGESGPSDSSEWGGNAQSCIGGLARLNWEHNDKNGFPAVLITESGTKGLKETYELKPLLDNIDSSHRMSLPLANYYTPLEDEEDYTSNPQSLPDYYYPARGTNVLPAGYPYVTWSCLDQAYEVKHRIHLTIREWNTKEEFDKFKAGGTGDPDAGGLEGGVCEYYEKNNPGALFGSCNDLSDMDDWDTDYPEIKYNNNNN